MPVFDTESQHRISTWNQGVEKKINIELITTDHPEDNQFTTIADQLASHAPHLAIKKKKDEKGIPGFAITENIIFHAFPLDKELPPFLSALSFLAHKGKSTSEQLAAMLGRLKIPVRLKLYIALQCPHCPGMVSTLIPLALDNPNIFLEIIDGSLFIEMAQKDNIMSAPCLILDDGFRWTGSVSADEVVNMCVNRDPAQLGAGTLQALLEQGDAEWITQQMIRADTIFDGFVSLLLHNTWSVRLGAMVIVEELADKAPALGERLCPKLISVFDKKEIPIQGDILYALGEAGSLSEIDWIKAQLPQLEHPDLVDAATEALETLEQRHG